MIRVVLPAHLRTLARVAGDVELAVEGPLTQRSVLDALETQYPMLRGTLRDQVTQPAPPASSSASSPAKKGTCPMSRRTPRSPPRSLPGAEPFFHHRRDRRRLTLIQRLLLPKKRKQPPNFLLVRFTTIFAYLEALRVAHVRGLVLAVPFGQFVAVALGHAFAAPGHVGAHLAVTIRLLLRVGRNH